MLPSLRTRFVCFVAVGVVASFLVYRWLKRKEDKEKEKAPAVKPQEVPVATPGAREKEKSQYENLSALEAVIEARQASNESNRGKTPPLSIQEDVKGVKEELKVDATPMTTVLVPPPPPEIKDDVTQMASVEMPAMGGAEMGGAVAKAAV